VVASRNRSREVELVHMGRTGAVWTRALLATAVTGAALAGMARPHAGAAGIFDECAAPTDAVAVVVGAVACQQVDSVAIGGTTAFSYFVPPACAPDQGRDCPVLYLLHGFGGDYRGMLGTAAKPSSWVHALSAQPPVDPRTSAEPWTLSDPSTWVPAPSIDLILVAPHGRTVPGGFGPGPDIDSYWTDWNPRYAAGGDDPKYATPPPRFSTFLVDELLPYVEANLPAAAGREWRAIAGTSLGGFGSYKNGLQHPDVFSSMGSVSGAHNFLFAPGLDAGVAPSSPVGVQPPAGLSHVDVPGPLTQVPGAVVPSQAYTFLAATLALGDPVADQAYFRGNTPRDLALNARAHDAAGRQTLFVKGFVNDTVPRRAQDLTDVVGIAFEDIVLPMNLSMEAAFTTTGVARDFDIHPGLHSEPYRGAWMREQLETQYAGLRHWDGGGDPAPPPVRFDYRSAFADFSIWGWTVHVERGSVELLTLTDVTCDAVTLQGTVRSVAGDRRAGPVDADRRARQRWRHPRLRANGHGRPDLRRNLHNAR
jgi:S-formylglutathione hydrolase FrmB